jgi:acyl carrier protein
MTMSTLDARIADLVLSYAQTPAATPLSPALSLRRDLAIDSLSLVSLTLRLGDELKVDLLERGLDLSRLDTVGDLYSLARSLHPTEGEEHGKPSASAARR